MTIFLLILTVLLLVVVGQYLLRRPPISEVQNGSDYYELGDGVFRHRFQLLTGTAFTADNTATLLLDDALFSRLYEELEAAQKFIALQQFWVRSGEAATALFEILRARAEAGVRVMLLVDYFGARRFSEAERKRLSESGVRIAIFRPPRWNTIYKMQHRSHIRAVVIDAQVAYTGGFGIDDRWYQDGPQGRRWRDTNVRLEGGVVDQLLSAFITNWAEATGTLLAELVTLGAVPRSGATQAGILFAEPSLGSTTAERAFALSISAARQRLYIANAYFVPDDSMCKLLCNTARRGVDVRVLTPGRNTDRISAYLAGRARYERLLNAGVRIFEYSRGMMHAKTLVADSIWCWVGTINFDTRSMALNEELSLVALDGACARELERVFLRDLESAREVTPDSIRDRSALDRVKEQAAQLIAPLL